MIDVNAEVVVFLLISILRLCLLAVLRANLPTAEGFGSRPGAPRAQAKIRLGGFATGPYGAAALAETVAFCVLAFDVYRHASNFTGQFIALAGSLAIAFLVDLLSTGRILLISSFDVPEMFRRQIAEAPSYLSMNIAASLVKVIVVTWLFMIRL